VLFERAEAKLSRLASRLLSVDTVFRTVQRGLLSTLDARKAVERNIERILAGANLPSARDLERVVEQLAELDREIARISRRMAALSTELSQSQSTDARSSDTGRG
jgi:hypothetical protein